MVYSRATTSAMADRCVLAAGFDFDDILQLNKVRNLFFEILCMARLPYFGVRQDLTWSFESWFMCYRAWELEFRRPPRKLCVQAKI